MSRDRQSKVVHDDLYVAMALDAVAVVVLT